jgi:rhomboid protease GluP
MITNATSSFSGDFRRKLTTSFLLPRGVVLWATMTKDSEISLRVTRDYALAQEWELVLLAQGLSCSVQQTSEGIFLRVSEKQLEPALAALSAYERENPAKLPELREPVERVKVREGISVAALLPVFFSVVLLSSPTLPWLERGSADTDRILGGELWRTVTALTLHADLIHVLSNSVGAALFLGAVYGMLGVGLGSALVLLGGAGGNLANALVHGSSHVSIGASTAIFGAVGMLGGLGMVRRRRRAMRKRRVWLPFAAALALLAMLGTGGPRVDILAHLFGFLFGGVLGILFALPEPPRQGVQWICGCVALAALIYCWVLALA